MTTTKEDTIRASSKCPICGVDTPHNHTARELSETQREKEMEAEFEKLGDYLWSTVGLKELHASYGVVPFMFSKRLSTTFQKYDWYGTEMAWRVFKKGCDIQESQLPHIVHDDEPIKTLQLAKAITANLHWHNKD